MIDVLIYSAAQMQECLINLLTYLPTKSLQEFHSCGSEEEYLLLKLMHSLQLP